MQLNSVDYLCCPACNGGFRLFAEKQIGTEVVQGALECSECRRRFEIRNIFPNLKFPENLKKLDLNSEIWHNQHAEQFDKNNRRWFFYLGIMGSALWETRARCQLINKLELKKGDVVLETGVGTGSNLPIIYRKIGKEGQLDGMDISSGILEVAQRKMKAKGIRVELVQANASYLPYKTAKFDEVLHVGAINQFGDKKRAIKEMHRVAKPGAKVVICDEGLSPGKEETWHGK